MCQVRDYMVVNVKGTSCVSSKGLDGSQGKID